MDKNVIVGTDIKIDVGKDYKAKLNISGNSRQKTRSGKNILEILNIGTNWEYTEHGIKNSKQNSGTTICEFEMKANQTYKISFKNLVKPTSDTSFTTYIDSVENTAYSFTNLMQYNDVITRTITPTTDVVFKIILWGNSKNETFEFQLWCEKDEVTEYEPYGAMPSIEFPSPIEACGDDVNLFDEELELGNISSTDGSNIPNNLVIRSKNYMLVKENNDYIISSKDLEISKSNTQIFFYDENYSYISNMWQMPFRTPANCKFIRFKTTNQSNINVKVKLQEGSIATPYSPYRNGKH